MSWHYVDSEQKQNGPVDGDTLTQLFQEGRITPQTLVWKDGMPGWLPYAEAVAGAATAATVTCAVSGKTVPKDQAVEISGQWVSGEHKAEFLQKLKEGVPLPGTRRYAGFWIRFGAKFLDGLILMIPNIAIQAGIVAIGLIPKGKAGGAAVGLAMAVGFVVPFLLQLAYSVFFIGKYGATPGKMACGLRVIRADGSALTYGQAAGRFLAEFVSMVTLYIGYIMAGFDEEKRALHDRIAGTRVVRKS